MRPPGEPMTCDDLLPISVEVRHKGKQEGFSQLHDPLQKLADLLGPQRSREGLPNRTQRPTATPACRRSNEARYCLRAAADGDRSQNWKWPLPPSTIPLGVDGRAQSRRSLCRQSSDVWRTTEVKSSRSCAIPSKSLQIYLRHREIAKARPIRKRRPKKTPTGPPLAQSSGSPTRSGEDGDRSQNWEMAIAAFEDALSVLTRERDPEQWATARMNLGVAYRDRLAGDRSDNLERAICAFEDSLSVWTRERNPEQWAAARMNLGIAYWERACRRPAGKPRASHRRLRGLSLGVDIRPRPGGLGHC